MAITMPPAVNATLPDGSDGTLLDVALWDDLGDAIDAAILVETNARIAAGAGTAPTASPTFTGIPAAPTAGAGTNTTQLATTAFDTAAVLVETNARIAADALKAPLASPTFTGIPAAPTAGAGTNTTQLATTAFVFAESALKSSVPGVATVSTTGNITALALPAGSGALTTYLTNASLTTIQGMVAGLPGQLWTLVSKGTGQVDLAHAHASGTALGKLANVATSAATSLAAGSGVAVYQYDGTATVWRLIAHEQGAWITPAFVAGNFTGSGAMTVTVDAGDVEAMAYRLSGRTLSVIFKLNTFTTGGTPANQLSIGNGQWGGFTIAGASAGSTAYLNAVPGYIGAGAGGTSLSIFKLDSSTFPNSTNGNTAWGAISFGVN